MTSKIATLGLFCALAFSATSALAAPPAAKPAAKPAAPAAKPAAAAPAPAPQATQITPPTYGAPVAGQCYINQGAVIADSAMGHAAIERMSQIRATVDAELGPEGEALQKEYEGLVAARKTTPAAQQPQWEAKAKAFTEKQQAFEYKVQKRQREMELTSQGVMSAIFQNAIPYINRVVTARGCATVSTIDNLLQYDYNKQENGQAAQFTYVYINPAMDITGDVIKEMNSSGAKLPAFDRVQLKDQPQQAQ